jgi:endoglycosylceramidase
MVLRGVNLSGRQKHPPYIDVFTQTDYAALRTAWGMNTIRFIMPWAAIEPSDGAFDEAYLDQLATRVAWAADAGLAVILDMHQDVYGEGFGFDGAPRWVCDEARYAAFVPRDPWALNYADPNVMACFDDLWAQPDRGRMVAAWRRVAERLAGAPAVIGFDPINEPNWGTYAVGRFERDRLMPYYDEVVAAVRGAAPGWVAFLEPSGSRNLGVPTGLVPFAYPDVVYSPHLYDPSAEQTGMFDPAGSASTVAWRRIRTSARTSTPRTTARRRRSPARRRGPTIAAPATRCSIRTATRSRRSSTRSSARTRRASPASRRPGATTT